MRKRYMGIKEYKKRLVVGQGSPPMAVPEAQLGAGHSSIAHLGHRTRSYKRNTAHSQSMTEPPAAAHSFTGLAGPALQPDPHAGRPQPLGQLGYTPPIHTCVSMVTDHT